MTLLTLILCLIMMIILHNQMMRLRPIDRREIYGRVPFLVQSMKWKNSLLTSNKQKENRSLEKEKNKNFLLNLFLHLLPIIVLSKQQQ